MIEVIGDLFDWSADAIVIPTNGVTDRSGLAVMGAGVAKEARSRFHMLDWYLGRDLASRGNHCYLYPHYLPNVITFPTKGHFSERSSIPLIITSCEELVDIVDRSRYRYVALPRVGCGLGGLSWATIKPLLERRLDDRFTVVHQ